MCVFPFFEGHEYHKNAYLLYPVNLQDSYSLLQTQYDTYARFL